MKLTCSTNKLKLSRKRKRKRWDLLWVPGYIVSYKQLIKTYKWIMTMWKYAHVRDIRKEINFWWYCYYYSSTQVDHDELIMHGSCKRCLAQRPSLMLKLLHSKSCHVVWFVMIMVLFLFILATCAGKAWWYFCHVQNSKLTCLFFAVFLLRLPCYRFWFCILIVYSLA